MRMWGVPPQCLCRKHLLGEHVELHMFVGAINKNKSLKGFIEKNLVDILQIPTRHDILVAEMLSRGYKHQSVLAPFAYKGPAGGEVWFDGELWFTNGSYGEVSVEENLDELSRRCEECAFRINKMMKGASNAV